MACLGTITEVPLSETTEKPKFLHKILQGSTLPIAISFHESFHLTANSAA